MAKESDSRRRGRRGVPRTIDLEASETRQAEPASGQKAVVPPAEPVGFDDPPVSAAAQTAEPERAAATSPEAGTGEENPVGAPPEPGAPSPSAPSTPPKRSGAVAAGAVAGAIVALLIAGALYWTGWLGRADSALAERTAALEQRIATLEAAQGNRAPDAQLGRQLDEIASRLTNTEQTLVELRKAEPNTEPADSRLSDLSGQIDKLADDLDTVKGRIAELGEIPPSTPAEAAADSQSVADLQARLAQLETAGNAISSDIEALKGRVSAVETSSDESARQRQEAIRKEDAAISLAARALYAAYRRGEPFSDVLGSYEDVVGEVPGIDALAPYATVGVTTDAELRRGFGDLTGQILSASDRQSAGVVDRLIANARALVEIRPDRPTEGDTPEAILTRIEADLEAGKLSNARIEWQALPEAARQISASWADQLAARVAADEALQQVLARTGVLPAASQ